VVKGLGIENAAVSQQKPTQGDILGYQLGSGPKVTIPNIPTRGIFANRESSSQSGEPVFEWGTSQTPTNNYESENEDMGVAPLFWTPVGAPG